MAELKRIFRINILLGGLYSLILEKKKPLFGGAKKTFWCLYPLFPEKNLFCVSLFFVLPEKRFFHIFSLKMKLFGAYTPLYSKKNLFSEISENGVGLYSLILGKKCFFLRKKVFGSGT